MNLSDRIDAAFQAHTGSDKIRGARTWFARVLRVSNRTVTRWCDGSQPFNGPALTCLELLEQGSETETIPHERLNFACEALVPVDDVVSLS